MGNSSIDSKSTTLFEMVLQNLPEAVLVINTEGKVLIWNSAMENLTGIPSADIIGKSGYEYSMPFYGTKRPILIDMIINKNHDMKHTYEKFIYNKSTVYAEGHAPKAYNGKGAYFSASASPLYDKNGNWIGAIETIRDITEIKQIEHELKESENHYRTLIEHIQFGIALIDTEYNIVWTNSAMVKMINAEKTPGDYYKKKCFLEHEKRDAVCPHCPGTHAMKNSKVHSAETQGIRDDGSRFDVQITAFPHYSSEGNINGFIEIVEDITDRKKSEILLKKSLTEKETLLKEVHHRVKNNLQIIIGMLNLQSNITDNSNIIEQFRIAENRIKSMSYIHEILYQTDDFSSINFAEYITMISNHLQNIFHESNSNPSIIFNFKPVYLEIPHAVPCALIINEVLTNSYKHAFPSSWSGKAEIEISINTSEDKTIELTISDNGIGISKINLKKQNKNTLGITLIDILTKQLKGTYSLSKKKGTTFTLTFKKL